MRLTPRPPARLDERLTDIAAGDRAALMHAELTALFTAREDQHLRRLVADFHAGTLTEPLMRSGIAAIAEGRAVLEDLQRTMRRGQTARHHATQPPVDSRVGA